MSDIDLKALRRTARDAQCSSCTPMGIHPDFMIQLIDRLESAERRAEEAEKERDALQEVADMYEWLRDVHIGDDPESINLDRARQGGLDAAIKAAMAQEGGK